MSPHSLAERLLRVALNMADERKDALFVILRDPIASVSLIVPPGDRMRAPSAEIEADPDNIAPHILKQTLHLLVQGQTLTDLPDAVIESLAGLDGALVTDATGHLHTFGAILRVPRDAPTPPTTTGALTVSTLGPALKVSEDGILSLFLDGHRLWDV